MQTGIEYILKDNPVHLRKLIILLGVKELCKAVDKEDFEAVVNSYKIDVGYWKMLIDEVVQDSSFDFSVEGELYEDLLKLQLWFNEYKPKSNPILDMEKMFGKD